MAYFLTLEGIEGAGKSTALHFIHEYLLAKNIPHITTREPGGTEIAEQIRQVLLKHYQEKMAADTELLLMFASRAQHIASVILPALQAGQWVICDRFTEATYAYQGGGRGVKWERIAQIEQWVQGQLRPDWVFLFDLSPEIGLQRIKVRKHEDRIEQEQVQFFKQVRAAYLARAKRMPEHYKIIEANQSWDQVKQQVAEILHELCQ